MPTRSPYDGAVRKLVLAFDIGTTYSGISYSLLDPGQIPETKGVTRYPAQEHVGGDSKIPTIIYYDQQGVVRAVGAEALKEELDSRIEDEGWTKAEWFKLHLRPSSDATNTNITGKIPSLPEDKTGMEVFSDFLRYMHDCARSYIEETHANGTSLWASFGDHIEFVLTHPNGWEGAQQASMRKAAILAGLVPDTPQGRSRIHFVTEGEASLHFCIQNGLTVDALKSGEGVLIIDAGGGTIDITSYGHDSTAKGLSFQEIASPECFLQGSIFVTNRARDFLEDLLRESKYFDDVEHIARCFDKTTKLRFRDIKEPQFIKFGSSRDTDLALGIRAGQLKLQGVDVATFFEPSTSCIISCILKQRKNASKPINTVFLVGGFAASEWLFSQLKDSLEPLGITFARPDTHVNKAVADGGVSFYIDHFVDARVAKYAYGIGCSVTYNSSDASHQRRFLSVYTDVAHDEMVPGAFSIILPKGTQVRETEKFNKPYLRVHESILDVDAKVNCGVLCYRGSNADPKWLDEDPQMYSKLCYVSAEAPPATKYLNRKGKYYYEIKFDVVLNFGLTELTAQIQWLDSSGEQQRSPAQIIYDEIAEEIGL